VEEKKGGEWRCEGGVEIRKETAKRMKQTNQRLRERRFGVGRKTR
jgi:hypothetical protein